ncbi:Clp protease N-terminal domain-containing protein [Streptomyces sp. FXY-T5]|uniref:Clp protease N-terminal domain-containing protein n=1 Tax=unclassified Streptomyces TaxID=2593676 RepID=UPI00359C1E5D
MSDQAPYFTPRLYKVLGAAEALAQSLGHQHVGVEHVFLAIVRDVEAVPTQVLEEIVPARTVSEVLEACIRSPEYLGNADPTPDDGQSGSS